MRRIIRRGVFSLIINNLQYLIALCIAIFLVSRCILFPDFEWVQEKVVTINPSKFEECVPQALKEVPDVSIDRQNPDDDVDFALNVKLKKPIPFLDVEIQRRGKNSVDIFFSGKMTFGVIGETDEQKAIITPVLNSIADAVKRSCN